MSDISKAKLIYLAIGVFIGIIVANLSLPISNLFLAIASILGWLVLMVGIPPPNSHQFRIASFFYINQPITCIVGDLYNGKLSA